MDSVHQLLNKAEQLEKLAAELYRALAKHFHLEADAKCLFEQLASEELQHALRIRMLDQQAWHDRKVFGERPPVVEGLDRLQQQAASLLQAAASWAHDFPETLGLMSQFEDELAVAHAELLARAADARLRGLFEALSAQDLAHKARFSRSSVKSAT